MPVMMGSESPSLAVSEMTVPGSSRRVGVLDDQRDTGVAHGEDGLLVQDGGAHVGELAQLLVGDARDGLGVVRRCAGRRTGSRRDVRPVLVQVGLEALGEDGARDVAAAAVEQLDLALRVAP